MFYNLWAWAVDEFQNASETYFLFLNQCRSQNAEKVTDIKGRLLDQAVILFNCIPFYNGILPERKEFAPRGSKFWSKFFPLRAVPYGIENHFYHIK